MNSGQFQGVFLRLVEAYVKRYDEHAFDLTLDAKTFPRIGTSPHVVPVRITHSEEVLCRIFVEGSLGLGESYCKGWIEVDDALYKHFLFIFVRVFYDYNLLLSLPLLDILVILRARFNRKFFKKASEPANINAHYSLSDWFEDNKDANAFYRYWLDARYVMYSCGKWDADTRTLEESQRNKLAFYAERLGIDARSAGKTLADLGCGWGGCLFFMAENYGLKCHGITLSTAQAEYIRAEIHNRQMENQVSVEVGDIQDVHGEYDYVISIGVMEHIHDYDHLYRRIAAVLRPGGAALVHSIYHRELFYKVDPFLSKYIFPGGSTPEIRQNLRVFRKYFRAVDRNDLPALSYPKTLQCWFENFCRNETAIRTLLRTKGKVQDVDYAIRVFKHYLTLTHCGLSNAYGLVSNILAANKSIGISASTGSPTTAIDQFSTTKRPDKHSLPSPATV